MIQITQIRRLLTNIIETDLEKLENIRIPYFVKAIFNFKNLLGGIEIEGVTLPKKLGNPGGPADKKNIDNANKIVKEMNEKIEYFEKVIQTLKNKLEYNKN